jgi:hypothetical protein
MGIIFDKDCIPPHGSKPTRDEDMRAVMDEDVFSSRKSVIYHTLILCQALFPVSVEKVKFKTRKEGLRSEIEVLRQCSQVLRKPGHQTQ